MDLPEIKTLPAEQMTDDIVDRIAMEVAAQVSDHIEMMYPSAATAVAWQSCKRSIQGVVRNNVAAAGREAERGTIETWLRRVRKQRINLKAMWLKKRQPF